MSASSTLPPRPTAGAPRPYEFPAVDRSTLANGLRLVVVPMPRLPLVTVLALVDAGAASESAGREGVAALAARTLAEGADGLDGAEITARFERLGTAFDASADWDSSVARLTVTRSRLDEAFGLFAAVLRGATFPEADVARRRDERLADIAQQLAEPRGLADERFAGFLYAGTSRYARAASGTTASVAGLDAAAVRAFHAEHYGPRATTLILVGDTDPMHDEALAYAARLEAAGLPVTRHVFSKNPQWPDALLQTGEHECPCAAGAQQQFRQFFEATRCPVPS